MAALSSDGNPVNDVFAIFFAVTISNLIRIIIFSRSKTYLKLAKTSEKKIVLNE